jgi:hypothetical protein
MKSGNHWAVESKGGGVTLNTKPHVYNTYSNKFFMVLCHFWLHQCFFCWLPMFGHDCIRQCCDAPLKTCKMNCGSRWEGRGRVGSKGWAVDHQPGTSLDGHLHYNHQKGDFQVSKKGWFITQRDGKQAQGEAKGGNWLTEQYSWSSVHVCTSAHVYSHLMNVVFRL